VDEPLDVGELEKSRRDLPNRPNGRPSYYLRQRPNAFPVVPVSTLSAPIASSNIVRSQLPTVADPAGEQVQFPAKVKKRLGGVSL